MIPEERLWLHDMAAEMEATFETPVIVNIGIFRGASLYCLRAGAPHATLYGLDIAYPQGALLDPAARVRLIIADSGECWRDFNEPVHLLFIDGDHSYKGVRRDIAGWTPKIVPGGVVAFHDFKTEPKVAAKHAGIKRAILEWAPEAGWEQLPDVGSLRAYRRPTE
jgi:predicted O-methyltransferase YrrM